MVTTQLERRGIRNKLILEAFSQVPRHKFVPRNLQDQAYSDCALPIGKGQTISQPYMVAKMTSLAMLTPESRVLEIGTGSGYQAAILAEISAEVYTIERIPKIAKCGRQNLQQFNYNNIQLGVGDGTLGWAEKGPFDAILVTAGSPEIPKVLLGQLGNGGLLVVPVEDKLSQVLYSVQRTSAGFEKTQGERCVFVPLIGKYGWEEAPESHD
jgi:protein-L-isoaspartate(D-aspartate) O-methyltransferase